MKLAYIVMGSCASEIFSQVMSLAKWLSEPRNGVDQVTGWKIVAILVEWCNGYDRLDHQNLKLCRYKFDFLPEVFFTEDGEYDHDPTWENVLEAP